MTCACRAASFMASSMLEGTGGPPQRARKAVSTEGH